MNDTQIVHFIYDTIGTPLETITLSVTTATKPEDVQDDSFGDAKPYWYDYGARFYDHSTGYRP